MDYILICALGLLTYFILVPIVGAYKKGKEDMDDDDQ